jgi:hypothetical protein
MIIGLKRKQTDLYHKGFTLILFYIWDELPFVNEFIVFSPWSETPVRLLEEFILKFEGEGDHKTAMSLVLTSSPTSRL